MKTLSEKHTIAVSFHMLALAAFALFLGLLLYIMIRPQGSALLIPVQLQLSLPPIPLLTVLNGSLPTFLHVYAFSLLTAAMFDLTTSLAAIASLLWFIIDSLFEMGQMGTVSLWLVDVMPNWTQQWAPTHHLLNYFYLGTFDWLDLLAAAIGAISAFVTIAWTQHRRGES